MTPEKAISMTKAMNDIYITEVERYVAARLNLSVDELTEITKRFYGGTFSQERDRRVAERYPYGHESIMQRAAYRGHATRQLIRELKRKVT